LGKIHLLRNIFFVVFFIFSFTLKGQVLHETDLFVIDDDTLSVLNYLEDFEAYKHYVDGFRKSDSSIYCGPRYYWGRGSMPFVVILESRHDSIYLDSIIVSCENLLIPLDSLAGQNPQFLSWFSDTITLGSGQLLMDAYNPKYRIYENKRILIVRKGIVEVDSTYREQKLYDWAVEMKRVYDFEAGIKDPLENFLNNEFADTTLCDSAALSQCGLIHFTFKITPRGKLKRSRTYNSWKARTLLDNSFLSRYRCSHVRKEIKTLLKGFDFTQYDIPNSKMTLDIDYYCPEECSEAKFITNILWHNNIRLTRRRKRF
jgi:hypothetical protein